MAIHIGERIRKRAKELRIGPTELGRLINTYKQNVYGIFKRRSLDTELLLKISKILRYDFFQHYHTPDLLSVAEDSGGAYFSEKKKLEELCAALKKQLDASRRELAGLKEKYEMQRKINALLEKEK
jgi:hypothetical protein